MARMLSTSKNKPLVGLDIRAGSLAASEVSSNGHSAISRFGMVSLPSGVVRDGEVADAEQLTAALKELFARNKLS
jgi:type IV pilus assembly protein PilM